jgi:hypothetical protein
MPHATFHVYHFRAAASGDIAALIPCTKRYITGKSIRALADVCEALHTLKPIGVAIAGAREFR